MIKKIDSVTIHDHAYLSLSDKCYYFGEYTSGTGYNHSPTNNLISNFKKSVSVKGTPQWKYKGYAIQEVIELLNKIRFPKPKSSLIVPIPPSKTRANPAYDDRISQVIIGTCAKHNIEYRELIEIIEDMDAFHESTAPRLNPTQLMSNLRLNEDCVDNMKPIIYLVDDVITTGSHFKACKNLILSRFPKVIVQGIFIARRNFEIP